MNVFLRKVGRSLNPLMEKGGLIRGISCYMQRIVSVKGWKEGRRGVEKININVFQIRSFPEILSPNPPSD
jgi:hypothetical protein